jgi:hypothetical protein
VEIRQLTIPPTVLYIKTVTSWILNKVKMKIKDYLLYHLILLSIFSFCCASQLLGQEKVNISAGMGLPELLNVGLRYQLKQAQIGISVGSVPLKDESILSVSGDVYYHFAGLSELSDRRPWYGKVGLNYLRDETKTLVDKYLYLNLRIGRDFNISKKIGIEIDAGAIFQLFNKTVRLEPSGGWSFDINIPVLPSFGAGLFYRI